MKRFFPKCLANIRSGWILLLAVAVLTSSLTGCVRRRMTIRSNPPGALVYVDDYKIGTTPVSHNFLWYGTRKIRLVKDNYETKTVLQQMNPPWWQIPPIDFFTENVLPGELTDSRTLTFQLEPKRDIPPDELRGRAEQLRSQVRPACYIPQPDAAGGTLQPNMQPGMMQPGAMQPGGMQPSEVVPAQPMQPGMMQPGAMQPGSYAPTPPGEWVPPGGFAPSGTPSTQPPYYPEPSYTP